MEKDKSKSLICKSCGAKLDIDGLKETVICEYCGTVHSVAALLDESETLRIEKVKAQTYLNVESGKRQIESEKLKHEIEKEKILNEKEDINAFKKSKFSKVLIAFVIIGALMCAVSFRDGQILSGLVAVLMTGLFIISYLMGIHIVKEKKKGMRIISAVIAFALLIPYFALFNSDNNTNSAENFEWSNMVLSEVLPSPESNYGDLSINSEDYLSIDILKTSKEQYRSYVNACRDKGFTVDVEEYGTTFTAKNEAGYELTLYYFESDEEMSIDLNAPIESNLNTKVDELNETVESQSITDSKYKNLDKFVAKYNQYAKTPITNLKEIDIQSPEYYRTEYRLNAFQNAPAYTGDIGEYRIEIVNEVVNFSDEIDYDRGMRIYVQVKNVDEAEDILNSFCKATDEDISQADLDEFYEYHTLGSGSVSIVIDSVDGYCHGTEDLEILLKASPNYFE